MLNFSHFVNQRNYRLIFVLYLLVIILLTLLPLNDSSSAMNHTYVVHIRLDYLLHCLVYLPFAVLYFGSFGRPAENPVKAAIFTGLILSTLAEGVQYFIPYRAYNINDLLANYLGILLGMILPYVLPEVVIYNSDCKKTAE